MTIYFRDDIGECACDIDDWVTAGGSDSKLAHEAVGRPPKVDFQAQSHGCSAGFRCLLACLMILFPCLMSLSTELLKHGSWTPPE